MHSSENEKIFIKLPYFFLLAQLRYPPITLETNIPKSNYFYSSVLYRILKIYVIFINSKPVFTSSEPPAVSYLIFLIHFPSCTVQWLWNCIFFVLSCDPRKKYKQENKTQQVMVASAF